MVSQALTENLTIFLVTAFFYVMQGTFWNNSFTSYALIGIVLGFCAVVRPFHIVWGIVVIALFVVVTLWNHYRLLWSPVKHSVKRLRLITLCFVLVIFTQPLITSVYKLYRENVPIAYNKNYLQLHLNAMLYMYRYETLYDLSQNKLFPVWYINEPLHSDTKRPELVLMPLIKLASLFQQHDYKVYRPTVGINSPTAFSIGLILWIMFCYVVSQSLCEIWQAGKMHKEFPKIGLLTLCMTSYVVLYTLFTVPETRFVFPIYPVLVCLFMYYAIRSTRWWHFIIPLSFAITRLC
jgi:hypothetical protein